MRTLIFRTAAPLIVTVMLVFSLFVLLRGHNEPGGGFIGGLIAAAAMAVYGMAAGVEAVERALRVPPLAVAGLGVVVAGASGLLSLPVGVPFLTGLWTFLHFDGTEIPLSSPMLFDGGVFLTVFGTITTVLLALEITGGEG